MYTFSYTIKQNTCSVGGDHLNQTELFVKQLYQSMHINRPEELSINTIAISLNLHVVFWEFGSALAESNGVYKIFINNNRSYQQQWVEFGHEMYHYCHDRLSYHQLNRSYAAYGESKADYFAYHFCVPTFMLIDFEELTVFQIMNLFNVEYEFALKRLEMYRNKILTKGEIRYGEFQKKREDLAVYY